ncbi:hypothetical protein ABT272_41545 [Streptomyces sp900105245]|uniref:Uncharacterized protein n=1 Tax=Streptomyces sp. 900105245 TaxID=3154379 RepID=A0ABV1UK66_9ACTN
MLSQRPSNSWAWAPPHDPEPLPVPLSVFGGRRDKLIWDESAEALYVIDFERSEDGPAVRDFVRLSDAWHGRPDLPQAVMDGYGRPFTPEGSIGYGRGRLPKDIRAFAASALPDVLTHSGRGKNGTSPMLTACCASDAVAGTAPSRTA